MGVEGSAEKCSAVAAVARLRQNNSETVKGAHVGHFEADEEEESSRVPSRVLGL